MSLREIVDRIEARPGVPEDVKKEVRDWYEREKKRLEAEFRKSRTQKILDTKIVVDECKGTPKDGALEASCRRVVRQLVESEGKKEYVDKEYGSAVTFSKPVMDCVREFKELEPACRTPLTHQDKIAALNLCWRHEERAWGLPTSAVAIALDMEKSKAEDARGELVKKGILEPKQSCTIVDVEGKGFEVKPCKNELGEEYYDLTTRAEETLVPPKDCTALKDFKRAVERGP